MERKSFLNYYKKVLEQVSFDPLLLRKEYRKALQFIPPSDHAKLHQWMADNGLQQQINKWNQIRETA